MFLRGTETRVVKTPLGLKNIVWGVQQNRHYASDMSHLEKVLANFHTSQEINNTQIYQTLHMNIEPLTAAPSVNAQVSRIT
jgi:S-adenosylhomocysteine hydrolase